MDNKIRWVNVTGLQNDLATRLLDKRFEWIKENRVYYTEIYLSLTNIKTGFLNKVKVSEDDIMCMHRLMLSII